jgi:hypothetical protein
VPLPMTIPSGWKPLGNEIVSGNLEPEDACDVENVARSATATAPDPARPLLIVMDDPP